MNEWIQHSTYWEMVNCVLKIKCLFTFDGTTNTNNIILGGLLTFFPCIVAESESSSRRTKGKLNRIIFFRNEKLFHFFLFYLSIKFSFLWKLNILRLFIALCLVFIGYRPRVVMECTFNVFLFLVLLLGPFEVHILLLFSCTGNSLPLSFICATKCLHIHIAHVTLSFHNNNNTNIYSF